jgi:uncharacterized membrane protein
MQRIDNDELIDFAAAAGIGAIAGLRSMTAPAAVSLAINQHRINTPNGRLAFLKSNKAAATFTALAIGELITDKLPNTPNRTSPPALTGRILCGGLAGAALCASRDRSIAAGALLGGVAAIAGAFLGYTIRKQIGRRLHARDTVVAAFEDAIAVGGGALLVAS